MPERVQARLAAASEALRPHARGVSWTPAGSFHLTMKFLGNVEEDRVASIAEALGAAVAGVDAFPLVVRGLGAFPSPARPRVIWAGVEAGAARLGGLAAAIERALEPFGFAHEPRPFSAHVTLGRAREPRRDPALAEALARAAGQELGSADVDRVVLMRSHLSSRGSRYTELAVLPLHPTSG